MSDAERVQRGYLLTKEEALLQPYQITKNEIELQLTELRRLAKDNPPQQARITELRHKIWEKVEIARL